MGAMQSGEGLVNWYPLNNSYNFSAYSKFFTIKCWWGVVGEYKAVRKDRAQHSVSTPALQSEDYRTICRVTPRSPLPHPPPDLARCVRNLEPQPHHQHMPLGLCIKKPKHHPRVLYPNRLQESLCVCVEWVDNWVDPVQLF